MAGSWDERRMRKARLLLRPAIGAGMGGQWADVGCGDGVFTLLLIEWLTAGSSVVAVDQDGGALRRLVAQLTPAQHAAVQTIQADFTQPQALAAHGSLDGMLLANSLHFVRDKLPVLTHLAARLRPGGTCIIIEYNAARGNWAVPHPFHDSACLDLMSAVGLTQATIVTREPSSFLGEIYTAVATKI